MSRAAQESHDALIRFFEEGIPFNRYLGLKVVDLSLGHCTLRVPYQPALVGDASRPAIHGGVISTLADTAGGLAVFSMAGALDARVSTVDLRVDYYSPAPLEDLYAVAEVVRLGNRVGIARIAIHAGDATRVLAEGKGVYNVHKPRTIPASP